MPDVIDHDVRKGDRRAAADRDRRLEGGFSRVAHDVEEVAVEGRPEGDQVGPGLGDVVLRGNPGLLVIAGVVDRRGDLAANEALMIVAGGVDEVAEHFFLGPAIGSALVGGVGVGDVDEAARHSGEDEGTKGFFRFNPK